MSSLSDPRVLSLVSRHFVAAWVSRDRYQLGQADPDERALLYRIDASRHRRRLEGGAVCVYIVTPAGESLATLPVQKASKPDLLVAFLKRVIADEKLTPRPAAEVRAVDGTAAAPKGADGRVFLVRTRFDARDNRGTSRDAVELTREEWSAFLGPADAAVGRSWKVPRPVAEKLLRHGYPPLPHWEAKLAKVAACELTATVTVAGRERRVRLEGKLELIYPHKGEPTDGRVTAALVGVARGGGGRLTALELASDGASYVVHWQGKPQSRPMSLTVELAP